MVIDINFVECYKLNASGVLVYEVNLSKHNLTDSSKGCETDLMMSEVRPYSLRLKSPVSDPKTVGDLSYIVPRNSKNIPSRVITDIREKSI